MKNNTKPENTRKTVYLKTSTVEKIEALAKKDSRTFSSWVALLLEKAIYGKN
jgi:hypothetical protein